MCHESHGPRRTLVLMADEKREPTQDTQPKGIDPKTGKPYEPVEIPVPRRSTFDKLLGRAEKPAKKRRDRSDGGRNFIDFSP
jgi:hypothetical protein